MKKKWVTDISAGGIVYKKTKEKIYFLLLQKDNGKWFLPKGLINQGESLAKGARREVQEETGLHHLKIEAEVGQIHFIYYWKPEDCYHHKFVHYYLMKFTGREKPKPQSEEGFVKTEWFEVAEAIKRISFNNDKKILQQALKILASQ